MHTAQLQSFLTMFGASINWITVIRDIRWATVSTEKFPQLSGLTRIDAGRHALHRPTTTGATTNAVFGWVITFRNAATFQLKNLRPIINRAFMLDNLAVVGLVAVSGHDFIFTEDFFSATEKYPLIILLSYNPILASRLFSATRNRPPTPYWDFRPNRFREVPAATWNQRRVAFALDGRRARRFEWYSPAWAAFSSRFRPPADP